MRAMATIKGQGSRASRDAAGYCLKDAPRGVAGFRERLGFDVMDTEGEGKKR